MEFIAVRSFSIRGTAFGSKPIDTRADYINKASVMGSPDAWLLSGMAKQHISRSAHQIR